MRLLICTILIVLITLISKDVGYCQLSSNVKFESFAVQDDLNLGIVLIAEFGAGIGITFLTNKIFDSDGNSPAILAVSGAFGIIGPLVTGAKYFQYDGNYKAAAFGNVIGVLVSYFSSLDGMSIGENSSDNNKNVKAARVYGFILPPLLTTLGYNWNIFTKRSSAIVTYDKDSNIRLAFPQISLTNDQTMGGSGLIRSVNLMRISF